MPLHQPAGVRVVERDDEGPGVGCIDPLQHLRHAVAHNFCLSFAETEQYKQ